MTRDAALIEADKRLKRADRIVANRKNFWGDRYEWAFGDDKSIELDADFYRVVVKALRGDV